LGNAGAGADALQRAVGGPAHDSALKAAVAEIKPLFKQCTRCGKWICEKICWNGERSMCKACAPILQEELAHQQAAMAGQKIQEKLGTMSADQVLKGVDVGATAVANCPSCGAAAAPGAKFCNSCGKPLAAKTTCPKCQAALAEGTRFCGSCGAPVGVKTNCGKCGAKLEPGVKFCGGCGQAA
jgi:predicted amidophosphoribosyltransferase